MIGKIFVRDKRSLFLSPLIASSIVAFFGILFHYQLITPHDWSAVAMWLPIYISPIWGVAGVSYLSERGKR